MRQQGGVHLYTYYVSHHPSYNVPLLALHACHSGAHVLIAYINPPYIADGSPLTTQQVQGGLPAGDAVGVQEHPTLMDAPPCHVLHPCGTHDVMALLQQEKPLAPLAYLIAWWRAIAALMYK